MDRKGASLDKKKVRNWAPKFLEKKGAKLDKKGAKSETSLFFTNQLIFAVFKRQKMRKLRLNILNVVFAEKT